MLKIGIFHWNFDSIIGIGGGEVLIDNVGKAFESPVHSYIRNKNNKLNFINISNKIPSLLKSFKEIRIMDYLVWSYINPEDFGDFDVILTSGMTTRAMIVPENIPQINLCFSPPRWLYDMWHKRKNKSTLKNNLIIPFGEAMRIWDSAVDTRVDYYISISEIVKRRLWHYLKRESDIIYPPVDVSKYQCRDSEGYYLFMSRLEVDKRPIEAIEACINTNQELIVAGTGSIEKQLMSKYKKNKNIKFTGYVSEEEKISLLSHCEALIFPSTAEDFGIVPIEALASGKPVICSNDGFPPLLIKDKYGVVTNGKREDISKAIRYLPEFNSQSLINCAQQFDFSIFKKKINKQIDLYYKDFNSRF